MRLLLLWEPFSLRHAPPPYTPQLARAQGSSGGLWSLGVHVAPRVALDQVHQVHQSRSNR